MNAPRKISLPTRIAQVGVPLLVLAAGIAGQKVLIGMRPDVAKKPRAERALLVETVPVQRLNHTTTVQGYGSVIASREMELMAEISGRVVWRSERLVTGGFVRAGEPLVRIDPRDYALAISQQQAAVERAQADLELEHGRRTVAKKEWALFGSKDGDDGSLALREPQLKSAQLGLQTARTGLDEAKLRLRRANVSAPFNALVLRSFTETGKLVTPQQSLATLVDSDTFIVATSLPVSELQWLKIPGTNAPALTSESLASARAATDSGSAFAALGSVARVTQSLGAESIERRGLAARLLGDLDPIGRMARLLVAIDDPMGLEHEARNEGDGPLPLLLGAYVKVELSGKQIPDVIEVPRDALRQGDRVYVYTREAKLDIRTVDIVRRAPESVVVRAGLEDGDQVITNAMPIAVQGMDLRLPEAAKPAAKTAAPAASRDDTTVPKGS